MHVALQSEWFEAATSYLPFLFIKSLSQAIAFSEADVVDVVKYFSTPECRAWREKTVVHDIDLVRTLLPFFVLTFLVCVGI